MTQNWIEYEGCMAGAWRLDSFLGIQDGIAVYSSGGESGRSIVKILTLDDERVGAVRSSWAHANKCADRHLLQIYGIGEAEWDGTFVVFAVMEAPDVGVDEILAERPLSEDESRSLLAGVARVLEQLHLRGLQHGSVIPSNMHVVGSAVKLGVDTISTADENGWESDMRQLGGTLQNAMASSGKAGLLPSPFQAIATGCLGAGGRPWTAQQVLQSLSGNPLAAPARSTRQWPFVATAALVLFGILGYWAARKPVNEPAAVAVPTAVAVPAAEAVPTAEATRARRSPPPAPAPTAKSRSGWAVIAATYVSHEAAVGRAAQIAKHSPAVRTQVFTSGSGARLSYVLLGAGLTREEADKVLRTARKAGAPRDSYVTKLVEK